MNPDDAGFADWQHSYQMPTFAGDYPAISAYLDSLGMTCAGCGGMTSDH